MNHPMKELETLLAGLAVDAKTGRLLPTAQLVEAAQALCPMDDGALLALAGCLEACSEEIYEYYRPLVDLFRQQVRLGAPEYAIRTGLALGLLDDEDWPVPPQEG